MTGIAKRSRKYNDLGSEIIQVTEFSSISQRFYFQRELFLCLQFYSVINSFPRYRPRCTDGWREGSSQLRNCVETVFIVFGYDFIKEIRVRFWN